MPATSMPGQRTCARAEPTRCSSSATCSRSGSAMIRGMAASNRAASQCLRAARRAYVAFMAGNRDFLVGEAMLGDAGVAALPDPSLLVAFGGRRLADARRRAVPGRLEYQAFAPRSAIRSLAARVPRPAAGRAARDRARRCATPAAAHTRNARAPSTPISTPPTALRWLDAPRDELIHGHTHRPATERWRRAACATCSATGTSTTAARRAPRCCG